MTAVVQIAESICGIRDRISKGLERMGPDFGVDLRLDLARETVFQRPGKRIDNAAIPIQLRAFTSALQRTTST